MKRKIVFIPQANVFSSFTFNSDDDTIKRVNFGDEGAQMDKLFSDINAEQTILYLLLNLDDRQKIIFLYQLLRDAGYKLRHEDCARTLSKTREHYMVLLSETRLRLSKLVKDQL